MDIETYVLKLFHVLHFNDMESYRTINSLYLEVDIAFSRYCLKGSYLVE